MAPPAVAVTVTESGAHRMISEATGASGRSIVMYCWIAKVSVPNALPAIN